MNWGILTPHNPPSAGEEGANIPPRGHRQWLKRRADADVKLMASC